MIRKGKKKLRKRALSEDEDENAGQTQDDVSMEDLIKHSRKSTQHSQKAMRGASFAVSLFVSGYPRFDRVFTSCEFVENVRKLSIRQLRRELRIMMIQKVHRPHKPHSTFHPMGPQHGIRLATMLQRNWTLIPQMAGNVISSKWSSKRRRIKAPCIPKMGRKFTKANPIIPILSNEMLTVCIVRK